MERKITKEIKIGDRVIGGGHPILIQSMTNTKTARKQCISFSQRNVQETDICESLLLCIQG
mgnify:CR=1 FL=1